MREVIFVPGQEGDYLNTLKVGIVGCGHLGRAIALSLIKHGLDRDNLLVSYRGNPGTRRSLEDDGLSSCIADNDTLFKEAGIILLTVKPQELGGLRIPGNLGGRLLASCVAGAPLKLLGELFSATVSRMMFSGPDTILSDKGVATVYPHNDSLVRLIRFLDLRFIEVGSESDLNVFTAGVCLPAAILKIGNLDEAFISIDRLRNDFPLLSGLFDWAVGLPELKDRRQQDDYIARMVTKGGVTEAIVKCLEAGDPLDVALRRGIARTREITGEIEKKYEAQCGEPQ
jgi:pyrroline-5-carboxylate reductase